MSPKPANPKPANMQPDNLKLSLVRSWRTVRVFISSTFRDMQAERDHRIGVVFLGRYGRLRASFNICCASRTSSVR
ncbi:MAG: DUF4062 domain-containing protein [candidate division WOR-3 bacterium]|nr:DUF4062 domain-containing protein [candidate division WOR-3 bacterium]